MGISEFYFTVDNISTIFPKELVNENINGFPAMLTVVKTPTKIFTKIGWSSDKKLYGLQYSGPIGKSGKNNALVSLAMAIQAQE